LADGKHNTRRALLCRLGLFCHIQMPEDGGSGG